MAVQDRLFCVMWDFQYMQVLQSLRKLWEAVHQVCSALMHAAIGGVCKFSGRTQDMVFMRPGRVEEVKGDLGTHRT